MINSNPTQLMKDPQQQNKHHSQDNNTRWLARNMSERGNDSYHEPCFPATIAAVLIDSFSIFLTNLPLFLSIFLLSTLPLSLLLFSLSLYSHPVVTRIRYLEALALLAPTRVESSHIWKESRLEAVSLLRFRALYLLPSYALSIAAASATISSTAAAHFGERLTAATVASAFMLTWKRAFSTSICVYGIMLGYDLARRLAEVAAGEAVARIVTAAVGLTMEVYLVAVMSLGLVVAIVEERFGWDAIRVASGLIVGRRMSGWVLSSGFVVVSGVISWELEGCLGGQYLSEVGGWRVAMRWLAGNSGLVCLFGLVVMWSYIVTTVFYFECRRKHGSNCG